MRLDKFIGDTTELSRTDAKKAIKNGRVWVNGTTAKKPDIKVTEVDKVKLDERELIHRKHYYIALNKPVGYVCSTRDPDYPTVSELLPAYVQHRELHAAGRLDVDTTGLVLLTDDGKWSHDITSPRKQKEKVYQVTTESPIEESYVQAFANGVYLDNDEKVTLPAKLEIHNETHATLILTEGRYHQVKRMFESVGNKVIALHRSKIACFKLPGDLELGEYRELSDKEASDIISSTL
ncbi:rRNA pseudouridine synthase [Puniceicoccaceae bacterium K14]|nr:rRNA pseudouridine synthase [Puniceicoccaceae bacterium K14]